MIDIWLIFCLLVPFSFTLVQTAIECYREEVAERPPEKWAEARDLKVVFVNKMFSYLLNKSFDIVNTLKRFLAKTAPTIAYQKPRWHNMGKKECVRMKL